MLPVTFGCPGDDSGGTTTTEQGPTTGDMQSSGEHDSGEHDSTSGGGMATTTTGMAMTTDASTTTGAPTTTGTMETTGGVSEQCMNFCADYFVTCGADAGNDYGDEAMCGATCDGFNEEDFGCRRMHLMLAQEGMPEVHCAHASEAGGGVC